MADAFRIVSDLRRLGRFARLLARMGGRLLVRRLQGVRPSASEVGIELRRLLEDMGMTYIKLGQFLAMRFDILPEEMCRQLARLFDSVPPLPPDVVRAVLKRELARPVESLFREFDWHCVAAASVAQVHKAVSRDGDVVAVKIQRPGIDVTFAADIRNFRRAARLGDRVRLLGTQSLVDAVDEFEEYTVRELDFTVEGQTAERLRQQGGPFADAPCIYWGLTTSRVLTMEFVDGHPLSQIIELVESGREAELAILAPGLDLQQAVRNIARASMRQLFVTGFFHADPHPGNIFLRNDGTAVFVDFGIFGQLTADRRETVASYIEQVALGNVEQSYRHFVRLLDSTDQTDHEALKREIHESMRHWHRASEEDGPAGERHLGKYISDFVATVRRYDARMTFGMLLFWRALMTLDATMLRFKGRFDLLTELRDFFREIRPTTVERILLAAGDRQRIADLALLVAAAPRSALILADDLARGQFSLRTRTGMGSRRRPVEGVEACRLSFALVGGSLAILAVRTPVADVVQVALGAAAVALALLAASARARP